MLLLIRHSQSQPVPELPSSRWGLSDVGKEKCRHFASTLSPYKPDRIITSTGQQAKETGKLLASHLNLPCTVEAGLHETKRETTPFFDDVADFKAAIKRLFLEPEQVVFGEESASQARVRFEQAVNNCLQKYQGERLAIVSHGTVLSLFIAAYNDVDVVEFWRGLKMPALLPVTLPQFKLITKNTHQAKIVELLPLT